MTNPAPNRIARTKAAQTRRLRIGHNKSAIETPDVILAHNGSDCDSFLAELVPDAIVSAEVTGAPEGVTVAGEKEQLSPDGSPEQLKATDCVKPFCGVTVSVNCADWPEEMLALEGDAARVKLATGRLMV